MHAVDDIGTRAAADLRADVRPLIDVDAGLADLLGRGGTASDRRHRRARHVAWAIAAAAVLLVGLVVVLRPQSTDDIVPATTVAPDSNTTTTEQPVETVPIGSEVLDDLQTAPGGCGLGTRCPDTPGTYRWFDGGSTPLLVVVPDHWIIGDHHKNNLWLTPGGTAEGVNVLFSQSPNGIALPTKWPMPDGPDPKAVLEAVSQCDGIVTNSLTPVDLSGLEGWRLDYRFSPTWQTADCMTTGNLYESEQCASVPINEPSDIRTRWIEQCDGARMSIMLFDLRDGRHLRISFTNVTPMATGRPTAEEVALSIRPENAVP